MEKKTEGEKKKEEAYKEKPEHLKDTFEFNPKNLKEEENKFLSKDTQDKKKKEDDDLLGRFENFTGEFF